MTASTTTAAIGERLNKSERRLRRTTEKFLRAADEVIAKNRAILAKLERLNTEIYRATDPELKTDPQRLETLRIEGRSLLADLAQIRAARELIFEQLTAWRVDVRAIQEMAAKIRAMPTPAMPRSNSVDDDPTYDPSPGAWMKKFDAQRRGSVA